MLQRVIAFSIKNAALVLLAGVLLMVFAAYRLSRMPVDVFPELNAPTVTVLTESGGLAADEVEQYITFPIETAVNGLPGIRRVRSASAIGLSIVWVEFEWGQDLYLARQLVTERLSTISDQLPREAHAEIMPISSITGEIMLLALSSPSGVVGDLDLRAYAEFDLRNRLLAIPGISQVVAIGGSLPEYQINVHQDRLALYDLTIADVVQAVRGAHSTASAGYLPDVNRQELPIRQTARVQKPSDIANTLVKYHEGTPVLIGQVADVQLGPAPKRGTAADRGNPAVVLSVQKAPGTNTLQLTKQLDAALDEVEKSLPAGVKLNRSVFRQSNFIQRSVDNVVRVLEEATVIVVLVLILFLLNVRTTIITLTALPLSLAAALLLMDWQGLSINVMTLGGLAVAVGVLVDDAIIDVENVFRRLRENAAGPIESRRPIASVIFDASNEIRPAMVFATIIIVIVFVPLLFLQGMEGRFFRPLGITYIVSILASLVVALTVTPAMCRLLLRGRSMSGEIPGHGTDSFVVRWVKRVYEPTLRSAIHHRGLVLASAGLVTVIAILLGRTFGTSFLPSFNEGSYTIFLFAPPGTSLQESDRLARGVESRLAAISGVRSVTRRTGRAERDEHAEPPSNSEIEVTAQPQKDMGELRREIDAILSNVPGVTTMIGQPIEHRLSHILSGTPAAIAISVYGEDLDTLRQLAKEIEGVLRAVPGTRDVAANREVLVTSLPIRYRAQELASAGLTPAAAAEQVQTALYGEIVAEVNQGVRRYQMVVRLAPEERERVEQLRKLLLRGQGGTLVRLEDVADIGPEKTSNLIARESAQRKAVISVNVAEGYNLGDLVAEVRSKVDPIVARAGYSVHYGGQFEAQQSASRTILLAGAGVAVFMLMLLQLSTGSLRAAVLVMLNLPLAIIGGIAAIYLTESPGVLSNTLALFGLTEHRYTAPVISIASLVGFVTLFGIAVRNGILLVNHYQHLLQSGVVRIEDAVVQGSMERVVAILMTALCAALGLLPLAFGAGRPGSELLAPLALVVLGGLISSTFLNLIVVPAGYTLVFDRKFQAADLRRSVVSRVAALLRRPDKLPTRGH